MTAQARIALKDLPEWPAALGVSEALAYTGLSESELRRRTISGEITFKAIGPNGRKLCSREQLDLVIKPIWAGARSAPLEDMDFGDN